MSDDDPLLALAAAVGVTAAYTSWQGTPARASRDSVRAALAALGHAVDTDRDAVERKAAVVEAHWRGGPPCAVAWDGALDLALRAPADADDLVEVEVVLEDGRVLAERTRLFALPATDHAWPAGVVHCLRHVRISVPAHGYHRATWRVGERRGETDVIAAPSRAWGAPAAPDAPAGADTRPRGWGVFAPVYALREPARGGAGDLGSLAALCAEVGRRGARYVGTLPLLAAFLDELYQPSPYAPASRLAWNELYLDLGRAPGIATAPAARARLGELALDAFRLHDKALIDYRAQYAWRRQVIDALAEAAWGSQLAGELAAFATGHALGYAVFRAIGERTRTAWSAWDPAEVAAARGVTTLDALPAGVDPVRVRTHLYAQWAMERQLGELAAGDVGLYLDLPVGVGRDSYDVLHASDLFAAGVSTGAPPDPLFVGGQDWGLPPLHPERIRATGWRYVAEVVRHHMRHAAMLRVDHVMGLHRLYWVPVGRPATDGVYVRYAADEQWAILALESHRHQCAVAGEDLGTVPPEVPVAMARHGASGLYVRQFAMPVDAAATPPAPVATAIACLNTHDTPTFAGWWAGNDIAAMRDLGFLTDAAATAQRAERADQKRACVAALAASGGLAPEAGGAGVGVELDADAPWAAAAVCAALYRELAAGPAHDVLVTVEDLWLEAEPQNVPGTSTERPNWQRPWARTLSEALADPTYDAVLSAIAAARTR